MPEIKPGNNILTTRPHTVTQLHVSRTYVLAAINCVWLRAESVRHRDDPGVGIKTWWFGDLSRYGRQNGFGAGRRQSCRRGGCAPPGSRSCPVPGAYPCY
ncbi:hypothetical protein Bbelb_241820 [Branchiostoma belcheri]|nr:hypothetical protein Bbelb_241820 [Branchiostoma belcheri]